MENKKQITAKSYSLRTENGGWLGQIVLTSDGMFSSVTDYGNFSYAWRSFGDGLFEDFILGLDLHYFAGKMSQGLSYTVLPTKKIKDSIQRYSEHILPALKMEIKKQLSDGEN